MWNRKNRKPTTAMPLALGAGLLALAGTTLAQAGEPPAVSLTAPEGRILRLAPGETGVLWLRAQGASAFNTRMGFFYGPGEYVDVGPAPAAGCAALGSLSTTEQLVTFDPTQAGGDLECRYTIRRNADSINDLEIHFMPPTLAPAEAPPLSLVAGVAAQPRLTVRRESAALLENGHAQSILRLTVHNSAPVALQNLNAGWCYHNMSQFAVDGDFPGGCGANNQYGGGCFAVDVPYGFGFTPIDAGAGSSCRVRLTSRQPYTGPLEYPIELVDSLMRNPATGGRVLPGGAQPVRLLELVVDGLFQEGFD